MVAVRPWFVGRSAGIAAHSASCPARSVPAPPTTLSGLLRRPLGRATPTSLLAESSLRLLRRVTPRAGLWSALPIPRITRNLSTVKNVSVAARSIIAFMKSSWRTRRATNPHARRDKCRALSPAKRYARGTSVRTSSPLLGAATTGLGRAPFLSPSPGVAFCAIPAAYRAYSERADTSRKLIRVSRLIARQYPP